LALSYSNVRRFAQSTVSVVAVGGLLTICAGAFAGSARAHSTSTRAHSTAKAARAAGSGGASAGGGATPTSTPTTTKRKGHAHRRAKTSSGSQHLGDRTLREGMKGHDVRVLQSYLTIAGYPTTVDGDFGPTTNANVVAFQRANHFKPDGVVTRTVELKLRALVAAASKASSSGPVSKGRVSNGLAVAPSNAPLAVKEVIAAANKIAFKPYIYGGGHGSWNDSGYDCSGSVSYALHGAGLLSSPMDSTELESYGSPGAGKWISIWANSGHVYMYVAGLRFDTSAQSETGGSRWTSQGRSNSGFVERHPSGL
jgi:peptidoglycan hydrolase-like protein with peptidoglycan-binding domain